MDTCPRIFPVELAVWRGNNTPRCHRRPPFARAIARSRKAAVDNNRVTTSDQDESIEQFGGPADMNMDEEGDLQRTNIVSCSVRRSEPWSPLGRGIAQTSFVRSSKNVSLATFIHPLTGPAIATDDARFISVHRGITLKGTRPRRPSTISAATQLNRCHVFVSHGQ